MPKKQPYFFISLMEQHSPTRLRQTTGAETISLQADMIIEAQPACEDPAGLLSFLLHSSPTNRIGLSAGRSEIADDPFSYLQDEQTDVKMLDGQHFVQC